MKDIEKVDQKDRFTGFKEYDLLHAGVETQDLFWSRERDGDPTANYLNLGTFPSVWRGPRQTTRRENGVVTTRGYPYIGGENTWLRTPYERTQRMRDRANSYYRCIQRLREKGRASTARASKRVKYDEMYTRDVCMQQA